MVKCVRLKTPLGGPDWKAMFAFAWECGMRRDALLIASPAQKAAVQTDCHLVKGWLITPGQQKLSNEQIKIIAKKLQQEFNWIGAWPLLGPARRWGIAT